MTDNLLQEQRENWGSRSGFVLAAVGSAVGLGNLWGFPYKVYAHGGGAFLIPYVLAMGLIGIPLLILEFSLGHMTQRAAPNAFRATNRRTEPIGWWGIILSFVIITYYAVILAWCLSYLVTCIEGIFSGGHLPWAGKGVEGVKEYFNLTYRNAWTDAELEGGTKAWAIGSLKMPIVWSLVAVWALMYLCIFRGVKAVSKVVLFTVPLPWIMLLILTFRGLTLPGAGRGLAFYLEPNWSELLKPETWRWAFGQMFFSMSLAFGVMITYASFLHRKSDINNNATIIGLADMGTSFIAGIAIFATLGGMSYATQLAGNPIPVEKVVASGPGMSFVAFPYALAQLPYSTWFGGIFFIALLTLGIDSAFSITESVLTSLLDKTGWNRNFTLIGLSLVGLGIGLVYCTRGGMAWLGAMDDFINSSWGGIALLGLIECVTLGWTYRIGRLREHANELSDWKIGRWWDFIIRYFAPIILTALFVWSLLEKASASGGFLHDKVGDLNWPVVVGLAFAILAPTLSVALSFIRSPGADTHAAYKPGQGHVGRRIGVLGAILALMAVAGVVYAFAGARQVELGAGREFQHLRAPTVMLAVAVAAGLAVLATVIGAAAVARAEATRTRPSGLARASAGVGVMALGASGGLAMPMMIILHAPNASAETAATTAPAATAAALASPEMSWVSYLVLTAMAALLVGGLLWCFYRAIKASGETAPEQVAEDDSPNS